MADTPPERRPGRWSDGLAVFEPAHPRDEVDALEAVVIGAVALLAVAAVVALAAVYLGVHSWGLVVAISVVVAAASVWALRRWSALRVVRPARSSVLAVPVLLIAAFLLFPGFRYATGDKDPGIYVLHATSIAETGELRIDTPHLLYTGDLDDPTTELPGPTKWPGFIWTDRGPDVLPSFYHLWPAVLATAFDAVGFSALAVVNPLIGLLCAALAFVLGRRLAGPLVGLGFSLVLATNMMQVWQGRYPTTETFAQALFLGAAFAVTLALQARSAPLAAAGGALVTVGFLNRGEGVALVVLAAAVAAIAVGLRHHQRIATWFAVGLAVPLPFAMYQAYSVAKHYTATNGVTGGWLVTALLGLAAVSAAVAYFTPIGARVNGSLEAVGRRITPSRARWGLSAVAVILFVYGIIRPWFGDNYILYGGVRRIRSYDERSLHRLAWFFSWPGLVLALLGLLWVIWTRWRTERALVVGASMVFVLLFLYHARNSPYLMWWGRRFVPVAVPAVAFLMAMSIAAAQVVRRRVAVPLVLAAVVGISVYQYSQSVELRGHDEKAGSYGIAQMVADIAGDERGVFLWERGACCSGANQLFGSSTWIIGGADTAMLPEDPAIHAEFMQHVATAAGDDQPVFAVLSGQTPVPTIPGLRFDEVRRITGELPVWEEHSLRRPDRPIAYAFDFIVYRLTVV